MKLLKNRRAIELSINFIVMLVLAIAVFSGGLVFASKFFSHAEKVRGNLDSQTERQLEKLLDSGSPVAIPINNKEIFRNKFDTFGVGVLADNEGTYVLEVSYNDKAFKSDKSSIQNANADEWLRPEAVGGKQTQEKVLKKNEKGKFMVGIEVPKSAEKGTYLFDVKVAFENPVDTAVPPKDPYDNPLQIIVKVP